MTEGLSHIPIEHLTNRPTETLTETQRIAAEGELNTLLTNAGRPAGSWSEAELAAAYVRAASGKSPAATAAALSEAIDTALLLLGDEPELVTQADLAARATQILGSKGVGGPLGRGVSAEDDLAAATQAVRELGRPGQPRRDRAERAATAFEAVLGRAIEDGRMLASRADVYRTWFEVRPSETLTMIEGLPTAFAVSVQGEKVLVDENSQLVHEKAERVIAAKGLGEVHPVTGALVYSDETYFEALQHVQLEARFAAEDAEVAAA